MPLCARHISGMYAQNISGRKTSVVGSCKNKGARGNLEADVYVMIVS